MSPDNHNPTLSVTSTLRQADIQSGWFQGKTGIGAIENQYKSVLGQEFNAAPLYTIRGKTARVVTGKLPGPSI